MECGKRDRGAGIAFKSLIFQARAETAKILIYLVDRGWRQFMWLDSAARVWQLSDMDADEREIYLFLKSWGIEFVHTREICRRAAGKRRYQEDPEWAKPVLLRMTERGILETNATGHFRLRPIPKKNKSKRWVSPDIAKILRESGVEVESAGEESGVGSDEYYDQL